jgi:poly-gamma-glutamate capsule biosynthesis protein CapA/YwtB (metallophosphatase superfamily)
MKAFRAIVSVVVVLGLGACASKPTAVTPPPPSAPVARLVLPPEVLPAPASAPKTAMARGLAALERKDGPAAVAAFEACAKEQPKDVDCWWELGWAYYLDHRYEAALTTWKKVAGMDPRRDGLKRVLEKAKKHVALYDRAVRRRAAAPDTFPREGVARETVLRIRAVGDTMLGSDFPEDKLPAKGTSNLAGVQDEFREADVAFVNYEGTFTTQPESEKCGEKGNCFAFRTPPPLAVQLRDVGFRLVSLANNHIQDFGDAGREETEKTVEALGLAWSGKPGVVARVERKGQKIAMIAFHSSDHSNSTLDLENAQALVAAEKASGHLVVVSFHGGAEGLDAMKTPEREEKYFGESRGDVRAFARAVVDAGADVVFGHGPHVLRGMSFYKGRLIAYSLGNFATYGMFNLWGFNGIGAILEVDLKPGGEFAGGRLVPLRQKGHGVPFVDDRAIAWDVVRELSLRDFGDEAVVVAQDGTLGTPVEAKARLAEKRRARKRSFAGERSRRSATRPVHKTVPTVPSP